jgi:hypothetical protein
LELIARFEAKPWKGKNFPEVAGRRCNVGDRQSEAIWKVKNRLGEKLSLTDFSIDGKMEKVVSPRF